jgi:hypothetical protein
MAKMPETILMPSLRELSPNLPILFTHLVFAKGGPSDGLLRRHFVNVIRLSDLALRLYEQAREVLQGALPGSDNRLGALLSGSDYLELCLITLRRALNAVDVTTKRPQSPKIERSQRKLLDSYNRRVAPLRNTIIHIDDCITNGEIRDGETHALLLSEDGASTEIGAHSLRLHDLAAIIQLLHKLSELYATFRE